MNTTIEVQYYVLHHIIYSIMHPTLSISRIYIGGYGFGSNEVTTRYRKVYTHLLLHLYYGLGKAYATLNYHITYVY